MFKKMRYILPLLLILGLITVPQAVSAREHVEDGRTANATIHYEAPNVQFDLYRVADLQKDGSLALNEDYAHYPVSIEGLDQDGWRKFADTMDMYVELNNHEPHHSAVTDENGRASFEDIQPGAYLVKWPVHVHEEQRYTPKPYIMHAPGLNEDDSWNYEISSVPKFMNEFFTEPVTSISAVKVWKDEDDKDKLRPSEIQVQLLENGEVSDTQTLSEENNWEYTWENLNELSDWKINEVNVPKGYTVTISQEGKAYQITNTHEPEKPKDPEDPEDPKDPDPKPDPDPDPDPKPDKPKPGVPGTAAETSLWISAGVLLISALASLVFFLKSRKHA